MAKKKIMPGLKRSIAVFSSLALLMSATSPVYMQANAAVADAVVSADNEDGRASKIYIYDEYGNDISDTPIIYLDNSSGAGQATRKRITVKIVNPDQPVNEYIKGWLPDGGTTNKNASIAASWISQGFDPNDPKTFVGVCEISASNVSYEKITDPYTGAERYMKQDNSYAPGKSYVIFTSQHGGVSRQLDVVVQEPAKDFVVYRSTSDGKKAKLDLNDENFQNAHPGLLTTANHKYRFTSELVTDHSKSSPEYLDKVEWYVFESGDDGDTPTNFRVTDKAEISQDGVFTPKKNGVVWIVACIAPTAAAAKKQEMVNKAIANGLISGDQIHSLTVDEYLREWVGSNLDDSYSLSNNTDLIKYYFSTPVSPFNQTITDRPFAIGEKLRYIWRYGVDKDTGVLSLKYDNEGNPEYAKTTVPFEGIRDGYFGLKEGYRLTTVYDFKTKDYKNVLLNEPQMNASHTNIKYYPIINTPKYINITIREENPAKDLRISKYPSFMEPGEVAQLELTATPTNNVHVDGHEAGATDEWRWVSENEDIVSIDENGVITAKKEGTASIKVYGETQRDDGSYVSAGCTVQVITKATDLRVTPSPTSTRVGVPVILTATANPESSTDRIIWESTNEEIATVTPTVEGAYTNVQTARVVGVKEGTCEIIARSEASGVEANRCKVTVGARNESDALKLTTPTAAGATDVINDLDVFTLQTLTINGRLVTDDGETSADDTVHWEVLDNDNLNVEVLDQTAESITLRGQIKGTIFVRAMSQAQYEEYEKDPSKGLPTTTKTVAVHVKRSCNTVDLRQDTTVIKTKNLNVNTGLQLNADLRLNSNKPYDHDDTVSYWMSSDPDIVTVDNTGYITAKKNGVAYVYAYSKSGVQGSVKVTAFTTIGVKINAVGAAADPDNDDMFTKEITTNSELKATFNFGCTITDQNDKAISADCKWTSSNPAVAQISDKGVLTVTDIGETLVTLYSGTLREDCLVKVSAPLNAAMCEDIAPILYTPTIASYEPHPTFKVYSKDENGNSIEMHELVENLDYEISYQGNTTVGKQAKIIITGMGQYKGSKQFAFTIAPRPISDEEVTIEYETPKQAMKKATIQDNLRVECSTIPLTEGVDYKVTYQNNTKLGKATMVVSGIGKYNGSVSKEFEITCDHHEIINPIITPATYTEPGDEFGTCAICGQKEVHRYIPPLSQSANPAQSITFERQFYGVEAPKGSTVITPVLVGTDPSQPATDALRWSSSNPKVATVEPEYDENGNLTGNAVVTGVSKGTTTITVFGEKEDVTATCEVKVLTPITKVDLVSKRVDTRVSVPVEVNATIEPSSSEDELVWSVLDPTIASVEPGTAKGNMTAIVTGLKTGSTRLIVKGKYTDYTNTFDIKVTDRIVSDNMSITAQRGDNVEEQDRIPAGLEGTIPTYKCFSTDDIKFHAQLMDDSGGSADGTVIWKVINNSGENVTAPQDSKTGETLFDINKEYEGLTFPIHAASLGTVTISAHSKEDPAISFKFNLEIAKRCDTVTVMDNYDRVVRNKSINVGDTFYTKAVLKTNDPTFPFDHGDAVKSWVSSDESVATVDSDGTIRGISNGKATIKVTALSGKFATVTINVFTTTSVYINGLEAPSDGSDLVSEKEINKTFDMTVNYTAIVRDQNESTVQNVDCIWVSSNPEVATVEGSTGAVHLLDVGETVITVSSGAKSRSFTLRVVSPYRNIIYDPIKMYYDPTVTEYKPDLIFLMGSHVLEEGTDYILTDFENNKGIGRASFKIKLLGYYTGEGKINYTIEKRPLSDEEVKVSNIGTQDYTGKPVQPKVKVTLKGVTLEEGTDYTISYKNNTEEGTATATITGKGQYYSGSRAIEFKIKKNYSGVMGDMDDDGVLTSGDALTILRKSVGLAELDAVKTKLADLDNDGSITSADALTVLRKSVGLA